MNSSSESTSKSRQQESLQADTEGSRMPVRVYLPGSHLGWGLSIWNRMALELWSSRHLTWRLFLREFLARYRQTVLGWLWALIMPLVAVGTFFFLNRNGILDIGDVGTPYVVYALSGLVLWQLFAGGLVLCTNAIVMGGSMVVKINFPKETLVLAAFGQSLVEFTVRLVLLAAVLLCYRIIPGTAALLFPILVLPLMMLSLGLGMILSLMNALFRDTANIVTLLTGFFLFLTPVLYPAKGRLFLAVTRYNPIAYLVEVPRNALLFGSFDGMAGFGLSSLLALAILLFGWRVFKLAEHRMAERIGAR